VPKIPTIQLPAIWLKRDVQVKNLKPELAAQIKF